MIKLVLFDLDGVLIDSKENMRCAWTAVKKKFNLKQSFENYFKNIGLPFFVILKKIGIKRQKAHINEIYNKNSIKNFSKIKLYPDVKKTLKFLKKKNFKLGIVTSKNQQRTNKILKKFKLNYFNIIVAPKKKLKGKPYPDQILYALKKLNIKKKEACYVGDMNFDYESAKNAKIKFIYAKYGYGQFKKAYNLNIKNIQELKNVVSN